VLVRRPAPPGIRPFLETNGQYTPVSFKITSQWQAACLHQRPKTQKYDTTTAFIARKSYKIYV